MKYLLILTLLLASCDTPSRVITTYTTDSSGRTIKKVEKFYSDSVVRTHIIYPNVYPDFWYNPYYRPYYYTPHFYYHPHYKR
jgi:hypothetical protein